MEHRRRHAAIDLRGPPRGRRPEHLRARIARARAVEPEVAHPRHGIRPALAIGRRRDACAQVGERRHGTQAHEWALEVALRVLEVEIRRRFELEITRRPEGVDRGTGPGLLVGAAISHLAQELQAPHGGPVGRGLQVPVRGNGRVDGAARALVHEQRHVEGAHPVRALVRALDGAPRGQRVGKSAREDLIGRLRAALGARAYGGRRGRVGLLDRRAQRDEAVQERGHARPRRRRSALPARAMAHAPRSAPLAATAMAPHAASLSDSVMISFTWPA